MTRDELRSQVQLYANDISRLFQKYIAEHPGERVETYFEEEYTEITCVGDEYKSFKLLGIKAELSFWEKFRADYKR